jgi:hypothetical protein
LKGRKWMNTFLNNRYGKFIKILSFKTNLKRYLYHHKYLHSIHVPILIKIHLTLVCITIHYKRSQDY